MSASLRTCLQTNFSTLFRYNSSSSVHQLSDFIAVPVRCHSGGRIRYPSNVQSSEEDLKSNHGRRKRYLNNPTTDPTKNPYIHFEHTDPIQRSMKNMSRSRPKYETEVMSDYDQLKNDQETIHSTHQPQEKFDRRYRENSDTKPSHNSEYVFEKLEAGSKLFSRRVMFCKSKDQRDKKGIILLEGRRLILDAIKAGGRLKELFITQVEMLDMLPVGIRAPIYKIPYKDAKIWSETQTPSGILGIFEKPEQGEVYLQHDRLPITIVCDQVRDPGNMGTLIRTAAAVGCERILAVKGCVDPWEPKVIRAGMASHFHIPIITHLNWKMLPNYLPNNCQVLVADNRIPEKITRNSSKNIDVYQELMEDEDEGDNDQDEDVSDKKLTSAEHNLYKSTPLSLTTYDKLNITGEVALIIGNESNGISPEAKKYVFESYGQVVTIPMVPAINSLNVTSATSVILYEIRRQLSLQEKKDTKKEDTVDD